MVTNLVLASLSDEQLLFIPEEKKPGFIVRWSFLMRKTQVYIPRAGTHRGIKLHLWRVSRGERDRERIGWIDRGGFGVCECVCYSAVARQLQQNGSSDGVDTYVRQCISLTAIGTVEGETWTG